MLLLLHASTCAQWGHLLVIFICNRDVWKGVVGQCNSATFTPRLCVHMRVKVKPYLCHVSKDKNKKIKKWPRHCKRGLSLSYLLFLIWSHSSRPGTKVQYVCSCFSVCCKGSQDSVDDCRQFHWVCLFFFKFICPILQWLFLSCFALIIRSSRCINQEYSPVVWLSLSNPAVSVERQTECEATVV